jgi:hypothetical protein
MAKKRFLGKPVCDLSTPLPSGTVFSFTPASLSLKPL